MVASSNSDLDFLILAIAASGVTLTTFVVDCVANCDVATVPVFANEGDEGRMDDINNDVTMKVRRVDCADVDDDGRGDADNGDEEVDKKNTLE